MQQMSIESALALRSDHSNETLQNDFGFSLDNVRVKAKELVQRSFIII